MNKYTTRLFPPSHPDMKGNDYELSHVLSE